MIINKTENVTWRCQHDVALFYAIGPGARAALEFVSFFLEFVGQRSHIVLCYRGALREVEPDLDDLRIFQGKWIEPSRDASERGANLAALVDALHYDSLDVGASSRIGDAIKAGDWRGIEGENLFNANRDVGRLVRQPTAQ